MLLCLPLGYIPRPQVPDWSGNHPRNTLVGDHLGVPAHIIQRLCVSGLGQIEPMREPRMGT